MKFKFSLDSVLKVRKHQEKLQKQKLAEEVAKQQEISALRKEVQNKLSGYLESAGEGGAENIHSIKWRSKHIEAVHQRMENLNKNLDEAAITVSNEREKLATAYKNLHIMEKVKEFEHKLFMEKKAQNEQKFMDEIATQTFSR